HLHGAGIAGGEGGIVIVTMVGVELAVETAPESPGQPVGVLFEPESAKDYLLLIGVAIPVSILQIINVRNAEDHRATFVRVETDGNIQAIGESGDFPGAPLGIEIIEDFDGVAPLFIKRHGKRVLAGLRDPEAAL